MSVPSMVHRSGDSLVVRSVVSGDALYGSLDTVEDICYSDELLDNFVDEKDLPECKIKRNYSCASCDYFTQNPRHFLYHLRDVHKEKVRIYECPNCLYASKHFQKLLRHTKMVHGTTDNLDSNDVGRVKSKKRPIVQHDADAEQQSQSIDNDSVAEAGEEAEVVSNDKSSVLKCSLCTFTARSQAQLAKHERDEHIKTKFFRCTKCTYVTHMRARFTKHVKYHSMPMIKCELCDFRTPYKWNLDRHCKNHNGRGAFRCSACNFTADIKQSLTVHEMNHHVPPVGQAAGFGVGRRRNKVGASDSTAAEEAAQVSRAESELPSAASNAADDDNKKVTQKLKIPTKKLKTANNSDSGGSSVGRASYSSDFIHPDDIIHHANGNIYIKNKCKLCNFKSAWDGEMAKHEKKAHNIVRNDVKKSNKKPSRPIPNLIPIPTQTSVLKIPAKSGQSLLKVAEQPTPPTEQIMSQKDINDICAKSANSALKDFASLFGSEDVFKTEDQSDETAPPKVPDLIPANSTSKNNIFDTVNTFKQKNASFFDKLKEKLLTGAGDSCNLTCQYCGHESKCLTEYAAHQKTCGKEAIPIQNFIPVHNMSSTRCQYCRQRCKSSSDLFNHLQTCPDAIKFFYDQQNKETEKNQQSHSPDHGSLKIDEDNMVVHCDDNNEPHPMENRVFVWNNIEMPKDIEIDDSPFEYPEDKQEDNVSLDLSIRTQSPGSESSYLGAELVHNSSVSDKIPTHGNDISIAQHKRVFKCPHCTFWASTASRFHVHIVGHLNKKPFECSLCAYRSNWRWDITKHIKLKSVRDPAHVNAKVLMTDETGRRNYTKYNKYLTEIHVSGSQSSDTSGGSGTRPKYNYDHDHNKNMELPKLTRAPNPNDFSPLLKSTPLRPPPPLKAADGAFFAKISEKKRPSTENKRTLWKCKKCNFKDASHEKLLQHVKGHYHQSGGSFSVSGAENASSSRGQTPERDDAGNLLREQAPFRCGHCHQVSNWKHVIQRHCRLKHGGVIRVLIGNKNGQEKLETEEQLDEPDHIDVLQLGTFKCNKCPFSNNDHEEFEAHLNGHIIKPDSYKCFFCTFNVIQKEELQEHLKLHGITDSEEYITRMHDKNIGDGDSNKRYKCITCPYDTNSKSQYSYHKQFHKPRGGQYTCSYCSYNVSKRHLLHQHLKVHGINITPQKQNGDVIDLDEITDEIEEVTPFNCNFDSKNFPDIPLVWVSKNGKFSKMFKCRFCPHVNLRKVNIQEHEKMHGIREKNPNSSRGSDVEHHCQECNYVCNNAGVLSSHSKVHQGLYGTVHCLVDPTKTDEEQIQELSRYYNTHTAQIMETINLDDDYESAENGQMETNEELDASNGYELNFCDSCPARFLKENEFQIHKRFHGVRLYYKCDYCTYTARQKPHLLAHNKVHTDEYQERTKILKNIYKTCPNHEPPQLVVMNNQNGNSIWVVMDDTNTSLDIDMEKPNKIHRSTVTVPLSGTELFQQKSEAQLKHASEIISSESYSSPPKTIDPQFGTLMHGNPKFIYPTYLKNGRMKEKRYKCPKCPSAFEKREQYKVHLSLHGSKQRYKCKYCDYSVKYYANYVQHMKKHQMNDDAQAAKKFGDEDDGDGTNYIGSEMSAVKSISSKKSSTADRQLMLLQQKKNNTSNKETPTDEKKLFWCPSCPYTNYRKDAVDNHQKRHVSISGFTNNYTCEHCDYSVPQAHFLREHTKLHFTPNKMNQVDGYFICDNLKLTSKKLNDEQDDVKGETVSDENVIFEDRGDNKFLPELKVEITERFNNNEGERQFVNSAGEIVEKVDKNQGDDDEVVKMETDEGN